MGRLKLPTPERYCQICGKLLVRRISLSGREESITAFRTRKYCSVKCAGQGWSRKCQALPVNSPKSSRQRARHAVPFAPCAICGRSDYTEVHHIDQNPMNNSPKNLVRLCKSCHAKQHRQRVSCVVCGLPAKGHHLCTKHWQAWRKSIRRGWDTQYTLEIKEIMKQHNVE